MISQEQVFDMIRKEAEYAKGWSKGSRKISKVEGIENHDVCPLAPLDGQPYSTMDFLIMAEKYFEEAKLAFANFTPDGAAVRIRFLKVASLLVRALQVHGRASDLERIAGVSSSEFPILGGGLKTFNETTSAEGCLITGPSTKRLKNEAPACVRKLTEAADGV